MNFIGHNLTSDGNFPAKSKFDLVRAWEMPTSGQNLHSFVDLIIFYLK